MTRRALVGTAVGAGVALNTLRLRRRLSALPLAAASDTPVHHDHVFLVAAGVRLDDAQQRAASAHALRHGLDVVDLVPEELTPDRLVDLARLVDTTRYATDRLAPGRGAYQALLIHRDVLARSGLAPKDVTETDLVAITARLKRYAPATTGLVVIPGLRAAPRSGADRLATRQAAYRHDPAGPLWPLLRDAALAVGLASAPARALGALALSALQPAVVAAGAPVRLRGTDLLTASFARRRAGAELLADLAGAARGGDGGARLARWRADLPSAFAADDPAQAEELRAEYQADLAGGLAPFAEPARDTCPWCGGARLRRVVTTFDASQAKPGAFPYDRCLQCRHVFQNPARSARGLDFYYRDYYDGLGAPLMEMLGDGARASYLARARSVPPTPRAWLDVGTGMGHFALMARDVWPGTVFDGLDSGEAVEEGARRGWLDHAHRGQFPDLAPRLAGRYDVISMFHYLEHTRDIRRELDTAVAVLRPGGHLLIEVPNPESLSARVYGPLWSGWLAPQHLNFAPAGNLVTALEERGLRVLHVAFGDVHLSGDGLFAWWALAQRLAPSPSLPWSAAPAASPARRAATLAAVAPLLPVLAVAEAAARPLQTRGTHANAYRVLARLG